MFAVWVLCIFALVLGGISFLLPVYGITKSEQYSVFPVFEQAKLHKEND